MKNRVKFYSTNDWSIPGELRNAEKIISSFQEDKEYEDINDVIELFNITLFFDNKLYLSYWSENEINNYSQTTKKFNKVIAYFFLMVCEKDVLEFYKQVDTIYYLDFWKIIERYKLYDKIRKEAFCALLNKYPNAMYSVLKCKNLVRCFDKELSHFFTQNEKYAEIIIDCFAVKNDNCTEKTYLPSGIDIKARKQIIDNYVHWSGAKVNYLALISKLKKCEGITLDDKIRYAAHTKYTDFWNNSSQNAVELPPVEVTVVFDKNSDIDKNSEEQDAFSKKYIYGTKWLKDNLDYPTLLNNFIYFFNFVDRQYRCSFLSNPSSLGILERTLGIAGNNDYRTGIDYQLRDMSSSAIMKSYLEILDENDIKIENIFKWFFENYLTDEFCANNFRYLEPTKGISTLEKILVLVPQLDGLIKQFAIYVEEGTLEREYFEFSSDCIRISNAPSMIENKYIYPKGNNIKKAMYLMFSDQSLLYYVDTEKKTYNNFPELISKKKMTINDFADFEKDNIKFLLDEKYIFVEQSGFIRLNNKKVKIASELFHYGVISYSFHKRCYPSIALQIQELLEEGELFAESSLFTKQEQEYIDYMLNVQQFSNGSELRNKYAHGIFPSNVAKQEKHYIELLKIMVLLIIKINEEFCLKDFEENG